MNQPLLKNTLTRVCVLTAIELALRSRIAPNSADLRGVYSSKLNIEYPELTLKLQFFIANVQ